MTIYSEFILNLHIEVFRKYPEDGCRKHQSNAGQNCGMDD